MYNVTWFELGNEQYNPAYADQVANMEARASKLGMPDTMFYMNPNNANWLHPDDAAKVEAVGIKDHAVMDEHVGGGGGVEIADRMFHKHVIDSLCRVLPHLHAPVAPALCQTR